MLLALWGAGCRREDPQRTRTEEQARELERKLAELARLERERKARKAAAPAASGTAPTPEPAPSTSAPPRQRTPPSRNAPFVLDEPVTLGPASPATATPLGALVNDKEGTLFVARLGALPPGSAAGKTPIASLPAGAGPFSFGRGPSLFQGAAYWISHGSLVRRKVSGTGEPGPLEILARDAHDGTRVAVPIPAGPAPAAKIPPTVAYVLKPAGDGAPLVARLWVEGAEPALLTAEGNSTHSVGLVRTDDGVLAVSVQARMAITPVHARRIRFPSGKPLLGEDVVVWVGGGIQSLTEMALLPGPSGALWGFLPHERSIREFGLARLDIGMSPDMDTATTWMLYPNGIDPAPVAAASVCGVPMVLYAAPEDERAGAEQELALRDGRSDDAEVYSLATESVIYFVSVSEIPAGALVVWVTDGATRALDRKSVV